MFAPFNQAAGAQSKQHFGRSAWSNIRILSGVSSKTAMSPTHCRLISSSVKKSPPKETKYSSRCKTLRILAKIFYSFHDYENQQKTEKFRSNYMSLLIASANKFPISVPLIRKMNNFWYCGNRLAEQKKTLTALIF